MSERGASEQAKVRLIVIASALAVRLGLRALLQALPHIEIIGEAASLQTSEVALGSADILLVVGETPDLEALSTAGDSLPAVLLLSENPRAALPLMVFPMPAWGILPLDASLEAMDAAIQALVAGLWVGDPLLMPRVFDVRQSASLLLEDVTLTPRELEVLQGLAQGLANKQIGLALGISEHTVKFHVSSIYAKLGAANRTEAVRIGIQKGWVAV